MNAWTGKGIVLAILTSALPVNTIWLALALIASGFATVGLAIEAGGRNPLMPKGKK